MSSKSSTRTLALGALGVVYGDIGTSPLYAFRTCFAGIDGMAPTPANVLGVLSLIFWSLTIVISIMYAGIILRADNHGEGGVLALMELVLAKRCWLPAAATVTLGLFGAALFFSDGAITPAITVMSAVEGLSVMSPAFSSAVIPLVIVILVLLFNFQKRGTSAVGGLFGPVMVIWFLSLAVLGISWIMRQPSVLAAVNPAYAIAFLVAHRGESLIVLAAVFLTVTGGEALYADMGHFGRRPIRVAWYGLVLPALLLNYFGQGALALSIPQSVESPFYLMAPAWALTPLVLLATAAAIIASQAVISGVYTVANQAMQLGFLPRLTVIHSSDQTEGQIYAPAANWMLMFATIGLVLAFGSSDALAGAYGVAIVGAMLVNNIFVIAWLGAQQGKRARAMLIVGYLELVIELSFLTANSLKIPAGGWLPLAASVAILTIMLTWRDGRLAGLDQLLRRQMPLRSLIALVTEDGLNRVPGTAVYLDSSSSGVPRALQRTIETLKSIHERTVLLTVETGDEPRSKKGQRVGVRELAPGLFRVVARYGFMESRSVPSLLAEAESEGLPFRPAETIYVLGQKNILVTGRSGLARWRKRLYSLMARNARPAAYHFGLPPGRVIEIGEQLEI
ncbi:MAG: potassium transporter Kup [Steroidobacteraceae bacterium]